MLLSEQAHAQAALELHGRELEPGHALVAQISDPSRKKSRSDADANKRELYIANIGRSVKEQDLRKLFEAHGTLKGVRVPTDEQGLCKGFAFVEFEDEVRCCIWRRGERQWQQLTAKYRTRLKPRWRSTTTS